jgi:hypothetical protein
MLVLIGMADVYDNATSDQSVLSNNTLIYGPEDSTNVTNPANEPDIQGCAFFTQVVEQTFYRVKMAVSVTKSDVDYGLDSAHGFMALYKDTSSVYPTKNCLSSVYNHQGMMGLRPEREKLLKPTFACVTPTTYIYYKPLRLGYDPWIRCQNPYPTGAPSQAFYAEGTAFIFLCPAFFAQAPTPTHNHCPEVRDNLWAGDADSFCRGYQVYTLLYELIRFCFGLNALSPSTLPREEFDWNICVLYPAMPSVQNPSNLLLYIACKRSLAQHPLLPATSNNISNGVDTYIDDLQW